MLNNGQEALMKNMVLKRIVYVGDVRPRIGSRLSAPRILIFAIMIYMGGCRHAPTPNVLVFQV